MALRDAAAARGMWTMAQLLQLHAGDVISLPKARIETFYAQSWAIVHYLALEEASHGANLTRYLQLVASGADPSTTWTSLFGTTDIVPVLKAYLRRQQLHGLLYRFSQGIDTAAGVAVAVSPSEMEAVFGAKEKAPLDQVEIPQGVVVFEVAGTKPPATPRKRWMPRSTSPSRRGRRCAGRARWRSGSTAG